MDTKQVMDFCAAMPGVVMNMPFGPGSYCYRIGGEKGGIFALVVPEGIPGALTILLEDSTIPRERLCPLLTIRCDAATGDFYSRQWPGSVLRPYHTPPSQQPYSRTVLLNGSVPKEALQEMLGHAYAHVLAKQPRAVRQKIAEEE